MKKEIVTLSLNSKLLGVMLRKVSYSVVLFFVLAFRGSAQDICKQIKKEVTDNNTSFSYETPYAEETPPAIRAFRNYSTNADGEYDNFNIVLYIPCEFSDLLQKTADGETEKEEMGVVITFDDKSTIKEDSLQITHDKKGDGSALRSAFVQVNERNIKDLTGKKIVKISLAGNNRDIPADLGGTLQQYLMCLKNVKKMP